VLDEGVMGSGDWERVGGAEGPSADGVLVESVTMEKSSFGILFHVKKKSHNGFH